MAIFILSMIVLVIGVAVAIVMKKTEGLKQFSWIALSTGLVFGGIGTISSCMATVPTGHTGVLTTFGQVADYTLSSGLHFKLPWQEVVEMDNRVQIRTNELSCFSKDMQEVNMSYTVNYQIRAKDAMRIYSTIGTDYYTTVVVPCVTEAVKTETAKYTAEGLIENRSELAVKIESTLSGLMDNYDIILVSTSIENLDFTDEFTNAVEAKQVAQQNKLKAQTEAEQKLIEAKAEADALLIEANAEAEANKVIAESLSEEILNKMYYDKWNGELPYALGNDSIVVMPEQTKE